MPEYVTSDSQIQLIVPLRIKPYHQATPTIISNTLSSDAGTVLYGNYTMEYLLPEGDKLRFIANHDKKTVQLLLFTHQAGLIQLLPGKRDSSLVADTISQIQRYTLRVNSYKQPLTDHQQKKLDQANKTITMLTPLLTKERALKTHAYRKQEKLRQQVLSILDQCKNNNLIIANHPLVSEGSLGSILYDAYKAARHYQFNRIYKVSRHDQLDFSHTAKTKEQEDPPCFIWDSELHIGHDEDSLDDTLRIIGHYYSLSPATTLNNVPANRFEKLLFFARQLWRDGQDWLDSLANTTKANHTTEVHSAANGLSLTKISPHYSFKGLLQKAYLSLNELVFNLTNSQIQPLQANNLKDAKRMLSQVSDGHWVVVPQQQKILLRQANQLVSISYFIKDRLFYPLPDGQDLYHLSQVCKRHLYWPERFYLKFKGFVSGIPHFFTAFYSSLKRFLLDELHQDFAEHIHKGHHSQLPKQSSFLNSKQKEVHNALYRAIEKTGFLAKGKSLEEFIKEYINHSPYVIARAKHPPSPPPYDNPIHRTLGVIRHVAGFFIDTNERNPSVGFLAMAAYLYGAGAILAPTKLADLLTKLHLSGLILGIEPTQKLAHLMSHGTTAEAISAAATYWQGVVAGGNLDKFFIHAISALKEDPSEIAIIAALALSLGYGITKVIPSLQNEMGDFPYTNYAALGGKSGAALYDTIMHPGDDWLLGTCKWLCKNALNLAKLFIAPFFEAYYYGYSSGFINGLSKSHSFAKHWGKQILAGFVDLLMAVATVPLLELSALLIHVPFRGITNMICQLLSSLGHIGSIGQTLMDVASRPSLHNFLADFKGSRLYGFTSPLGRFSEHKLLNMGINTFRVLFLPALQLILNTLILPLIDSISLVIRLAMTVLNPLSRLIIYPFGAILFGIGTIWDKTIGPLFLQSAYGLTLVCNWLDAQAGQFKQSILSSIQIQRNTLFYWAFSQEDSLLHSVATDEEYYSSNPQRCELIPHSDKNCLLGHLLKDNPAPLAKSKANIGDSYPPLFNQQTPQKASESHDSYPQVFH